MKNKNFSDVLFVFCTVSLLCIGVTKMFKDVDSKMQTIKFEKLLSTR